jgi:photosystem I subunit 9
MLPFLHVNYDLYFINRFKIMENFQKYLSTAPVLLTIWLTFTAGFIIEINRFFPDMLGLYL